MTALRLPLLLMLTLLTACATSPKLETAGVDQTLTPKAVAEGNIEAGARVMWGGVIIATTNLKEQTQIEILAYPLDDDQHPDTAKPPLGRFLATQGGYLESNVYSQGRLITLTGSLQEKVTGRIGAADYIYPLIKIEQLHLWPERGDSAEPRFHFGIGVMLHN